MSEQTIGYFLGDLTTFLIIILNKAIIVFIIYKLIKKLIDYKVASEQKYKAYYENQFKNENTEPPKTSNTEDDFRRWKTERERRKQ